MSWYRVRHSTATRSTSSFAGPSLASRPRSRRTRKPLEKRSRRRTRKRMSGWFTPIPKSVRRSGWRNYPNTPGRRLPRDRWLFSSWTSAEDTAVSKRPTWTCGPTMFPCEIANFYTRGKDDFPSERSFNGVAGFRLYVKCKGCTENSVIVLVASHGAEHDCRFGALHDIFFVNAPPVCISQDLTATN